MAFRGLEARARRLGWDVHHRLSGTIGAVLSALVAAAVPCAGHAEDAPPKRLSCHFEQGHTWSYESGKFRAADPSPLNFTIEDIDLAGQAAKLVIDGSHTGTLRIVRALNANSYLEVAQEGFLNLTTIYDKDEATGSYPAVHSRHFGLLGQPVFAQYAGSCTDK